ncbi:PREDICTED: uncharacterized protein LOC104789745 [Camelina sativa]|uniref:Uncharacterized protein LOC104789745 n=1 Tax=Camelina sativa TaxID=90675 RepID=A0ABM1RPN2_CAMSA|nr:PREDICTED: uncharacterized protein LOC104789745 [Camelina sativa]
MVSELMALASMAFYSVPSLNISNCVTVTLTQKNYILWKSQFESFLAGQGLLGFVTGSISAPSTTAVATSLDGTRTEATNPEYSTWHRTDQLIILTEYPHLGCLSFKGVYMTLDKKDRTMESYLRDLKGICDQLASVDSPVTEKMKIFAAMNGLGREYEPIKTTIETLVDSSPNLTLDDVIPKLTGYDDRLVGYLSETAVLVTPHVAFHVSQPTSEYYHQNNSRGRGNGNRYGRGRGSFSTRGRGFHQQIFSDGSQTTRSSVVCQICGKTGHHALKCWHRFDNGYQYEDVPRALAAMRITKVTDQQGADWLPDSGSSAHVTNTVQNLQ